MDRLPLVSGRSRQRNGLRLATACALAVCLGATGCKSPWGWWGGNSGGSMFSSAAPDVGKQRYDGLSQDFSSGASGAYKPPVSSSDGYFTSAWKKSTAAVGSAFTWKSNNPVDTDDPTNLDSRPKSVGPDVFIAAGRMYETQGKFPEALTQYEKALKASPNDLASLISIARLHDRQGNFPKAIEAYNRAAKAHPKSGLVQNDLGLCYARQKDSNRAVDSLMRACEFSPKNPKYRNNLATVLVEAGRTEEAFRQLNTLNSEGTAHYNIACMLTPRGKHEEAAQHLKLALQAEPDLMPARELLAQITGVPMQPPTGMQQPDQPFAQVAGQQAMDARQQALSMFQAGPPQRTAPQQTSPFQNASSSNPVEITFPTAPANAPPATPFPNAAPPAFANPQPVQATPEETTFRIGDDESPQLLPPVTE
jgi:tetratricopeptide (TPR) repeat protein